MSMKKILTLVMAVCSVMAVSAKELQKVDHSTMKFSQAKMVSDLTKRNMFTKGEARIAAGGGVDTAYYGLPMYTFHQGYTPQGYSYYGSYIIASVDDSLVFYNASAQHNGYQYGWYVNGVNPYDGSTSPYIADSLLFWTPDDGIEEDGHYYVPELLNENGDTYQYGSADEDGTFIWASPASYVGMTSVDVDDETFGAYNWSASGNDYFMGTGMFYDSDTLDTYVTFIGTPNATMTVDTISLYFWSHNLTGPFANQTAGLTMVLFDENGNNIGAYKATAKDIAWSQTGGIMVGQLNFAITATFKGEAQCYLLGFNNPGVSIGCMTDDNSLNGNHSTNPATYIGYKGRLVSFGNNIGVFFNAKFGAATAIENNAAAVKATKALVNGQLVITKGNRNYNILGAKL